MIKNLIFDFGKVLVDYDFLHVIDTFFTDAPQLRQEFIDTILTEEWQRTLDREDKPFPEYIAEMKQMYPRLAPYIQLFNDRYQEFITGEMPGMRELLTQLKAQGYKLYGLTNWSTTVYEVMRRYEIFRLLDGQLISAEEHMLKPDAEIYHRLYEKFNLRPEECLFADDREENIRGGQQTGMDGIVFRSTEQYARELAQKIQNNK